MITSAQCLERYGKPELEKDMVLFDVPKELELGVIPKRVYCNKDLVKPLTQAFKNIIDRGLVDQLKTWDGCFNIRNKKSGLSPSLHSWGFAIDINAAWNGFNKKPTMSKELVQCFKDAGFEWGGDWKVKDGMHFQLKEFPK
jgi:hypothetical protein